jgi:nitroreductase
VPIKGDAMDVYGAIKDRRSVRAYKPAPIPGDMLRRVLDAGRLAPSAKNRQEWRFIVVQDPAVKERVVEATNRQDFAGTAPVMLVFCSTEDDYTMRCGQKGSSVDTSIALAYVTLAAVAEGLGTCWLGSYYEDKVKEALGIPPEARVVGMTPLGYPADEPAVKGRKSFEEVVSFNGW